MASLIEATSGALALLLTGDPELWEIVGVSFSVSLRALAIATPPAFLLAVALTFWRFPGRGLLLSLFQTLLAVPAVVVGLTVYLVLSRSGPMGELRWLFTQQAMVIGQILLCFPVLVCLGHAALQGADRRAWETALTLGASPARAVATLMHEVRYGLIAAVITAFGRIIAEVGSALMVGGNILNYTRNITTAIALETSKGDLALALGLGLVLLLLALGVNAAAAVLRELGFRAEG